MPPREHRTWRFQSRTLADRLRRFRENETHGCGLTRLVRTAPATTRLGALPLSARSAFCRIRRIAALTATRNGPLGCPRKLAAPAPFRSTCSAASHQRCLGPDRAETRAGTALRREPGSSQRCVLSTSANPHFKEEHPQLVWLSGAVLGYHANPAPLDRMFHATQPTLSTTPAARRAFSSHRTTWAFDFWHPVTARASPVRYLTGLASPDQGRSTRHPVER